MKLLHGDCLELMKDIEDKSIDMILCDLPYGTTDCKWDSVIPFTELWKHYKRIIKENGIIVLFGTQPFTSMLINSNIDMFLYSYVWIKHHKTGHLNAKIKPMKRHEEIVVYSFDKSKKRKYYPQGLIEINKKMKTSESHLKRGKKGNETSTVSGRLKKTYIQTHKNYPDDVLNFKSCNNNKLHPTQKPTVLLEYLIKTYTNENDLVLDNCMGSASTGIACINTKRNFIGIEKNEKYYNVAKERIEKYETIKR
jgi:site-specific DNA-methyltransferase (adenine-specific)